MLTKLFYLTLLVHIGITTPLGAKGTELTVRFLWFFVFFLFINRFSQRNKFVGLKNFK